MLPNSSSHPVIFQFACWKLRWFLYFYFFKAHVRTQNRISGSAVTCGSGAEHRTGTGCENRGRNRSAATFHPPESYRTTRCNLHSGTTNPRWSSSSAGSRIYCCAKGPMRTRSLRTARSRDQTGRSSARSQRSVTTYGH